MNPRFLTRPSSCLPFTLFVFRLALCALQLPRSSQSVLDTALTLLYSPGLAGSIDGYTLLPSITIEKIRCKKEEPDETWQRTAEPPNSEQRRQHSEAILSSFGSDHVRPRLPSRATAGYTLPKRQPATAASLRPAGPTSERSSCPCALPSEPLFSAPLSSRHRAHLCLSRRSRSHCIRRPHLRRPPVVLFPPFRAGSARASFFRRDDRNARLCQLRQRRADERECWFDGLGTTRRRGRRRTTDRRSSGRGAHPSKSGRGPADETTGVCQPAEAAPSGAAHVPLPTASSSSFSAAVSFPSILAQSFLLPFPTATLRLSTSSSSPPASSPESIRPADPTILFPEHQVKSVSIPNQLLSLSQSFPTSPVQLSPSPSPISPHPRHPILQLLSIRRSLNPSSR
jgi:hypothetical protein